MKPETRQPGSGDCENPPLRVSARIAQQKRQPSKQFDVPPKPLAPKAARNKATEGKQKAPRPKKPAPAKSKQLVQKKKTKPRPSQVSRIQNIREKALHEFERRTANDPFPQDLETWKSNRAPVISEDPDDFDDSSTKMTAYDPLMPERLTEFGVFDETYSEDIEDLKTPKNIHDIVNSITSLQNDSTNEAQLRQEYKAWLETILKPVFNEDDAGRYFNGYMDVPPYDPPAPHFLAIKQQWTAPIDSQIKTWKANPDFVEGIAGPQLPNWISTALGSYVRPDIAMAVALPNFIAEFKGKGVMKIAHQQARLDGGYASQGFFKLYEHLRKLGEGKRGEPYKNLDFTQNFLGQALVGSIEYNGEVMIGNVHWASRSKDADRKVDYHMRRVMGHLTRGLGFDDFVKYRAEARNFRRYFSNVRENIFKELSDLPHPKKPAETYDNLAGTQLKAMCKLRGISIGKRSVADLRKSLQEDDGRNSKAIAASSATHGHPGSPASVNIMTPPMPSMDVPSPSIPNSSFGRLRARSEDDLEDRESPSKRPKI